MATERRIPASHTSNATSIDVAPDSDDGTLRVWNVSDGSELSCCNPGSGMIRAVRVLPDGQCVLFTGSDGSLRLWRLPRPKRLDDQ